MPHSGCTQLYKHTKYRHTRSERKTICMLNQYSDKYSKRNIDIIKSFLIAARMKSLIQKNILVKVIVSEETLGTNFR